MCAVKMVEINIILRFYCLRFYRIRGADTFFVLLLSLLQWPVFICCVYMLNIEYFGAVQGKSLQS